MDRVTIRDNALGLDQTLEGALASAIKAAQAASAALESLTVSLMLAASHLHKPSVEAPENGCGHLDMVNITTMGGNLTQICPDCGETFTDATTSDQ